MKRKNESTCRIHYSPDKLIRVHQSTPSLVKLSLAKFAEYSQRL